MKPQVYVYDPTAKDEASRVRGIGRYLQILRENFEKEFIFTSNLSSISRLPSSVFINPFFNFLSPPLTLKRIARKQIAVIHDLIPLKYPAHFPVGLKGNINVFLNHLALRNYDAIITDSQASKKDIVNILRLPENKIHVVYPCLPKIFLNRKPISTNFNEFQLISTNFCLYVGDATWNKNLVNLARAIKKANVTCVFVGKVFERAVGVASEVTNKYSFHERQNLPRVTNNPWQQELRDFTAEVGDDKLFIFAGYIPDSDLINFYQQARLTILPSRDEGFGFSYVEAATVGCPSVLADIPVLQEISDGKALFFDPQNVDEMGSVIGEVFFHDQKRKQLAEKAKKRSKFFSPLNFKKSFLNILQNM